MSVVDAQSAQAEQALLVRMLPAIDLTGERFFAFCQQNPDLRIERTAEGDIAVMAPTGGETSARNARLVAEVIRWADEEGSGVAFDSAVGFELPDGAVRSPDVSWVRRDRLARLSSGEKQRFLPLCPDFVIELCSPSDSLVAIERKMEEYRAHGTRLGWLIDPAHIRVTVYHRDGVVEQHDQPATIAGDPVLPGFVLSLSSIWDPPF